MKILHCADIHLDSAMKTHFDTATAKQRRDEILDTFLRMMERASKEQVRAVLIAGDLYDKRNVTKRVRSAVLGCIAKYPDMQVYYLKGNHDHAGAEEAGDAKIPENLHFFGEDWSEYVLDDSGRRKVMLYGAELSKENSQKLHESLYVAQDDINIVMLHGQTTKYMQGGKAETVALDRLKNRGIDYLALGHVHAHAEEALDKRGVWVYPGCLEGRGFDECGVHGFMLLDVDTEKGKVEREFIPFASRTLHEFPVDVSGCSDANEVFDRVYSAWEKAAIPDSDLVKLILTGEVSEGCDPDPGLLTQQFGDKVYFLKVRDKTSEAIDTDRIAGEKSVRGAYVRMILADKKSSEEEKKALIRTGILALAGEWDRLEESWEKQREAD